MAPLTFTSGSPADAARSGANGAIDAIACNSAGTCTAVGHLAPPSQKVLFTVSEQRGVWGTARAVPGLGALLGRGTTGARFSDLSCPSTGNCVAGGSFSPNGRVTRAFVVSEKNGTWGKPRQVTGLAALTASSAASVGSISCPSVGNCGVAGTYQPSRGKPVKSLDVFLVGERRGVWGKAQEVPGLARLNTGQDDGGFHAGLNQISCTGAGNCLAVGFYNSPKGIEPFAVTEKHGTWGKAQPFPRIIAANTGFWAQITSVSCRLAGNCTGVAMIWSSETSAGVFALSQKNGIWGALTQIPVPAPLPVGIGSLTCPSPGNCTAAVAANTDLNNSGAIQPYVAAEKNGTWGLAQALSGVAKLSIRATLSDVICRSAGNCSAAGTYGFLSKLGSGAGNFVSTEKNGTWGAAAVVPGLARLNLGKQVGTPVLSCGASGDCSLGGFYVSGGLRKPYLVTQKNGVWGNATEVKGVEP